MYTMLNVFVIISMLLSSLSPVFTQPNLSAAMNVKNIYDIAETITPTSSPTDITYPVETPVPVSTDTPPDAAATAPVVEAKPISVDSVKLQLVLELLSDAVQPSAEIIIAWQIEEWDSLVNPDDVSLVFSYPADDLSPVQDMNRKGDDSNITTLQLPITESTGQLVFRLSDKANLPILLHADILQQEQVLSGDDLWIEDPASKKDEKSALAVEMKGGAIAGLNDKVKVSVPEGALAEDTKFWIHQPKFAEDAGDSRIFEIIAETSAGRQKVDHFARSITIQASYPEEEFTVNEQSLAMFYYDEEANDWRLLPSWVDAESNTISAYSDHLTVFKYDIQTFEMSRLPSMKQYSISQFTGAATYGLPIEVPPAPGGLQPSISVSYNSQVVDGASAVTQASMVGMGWSLDAGGSITRNMNGTSDYLADDTFSISVGGFSSLLVPGADGYYHTQDENFWRIQKNSDDTWTVWDKTGTKYSFGINYPNDLPHSDFNEYARSWPESRAKFPRFNFEYYDPVTKCNTDFDGYATWQWPLVKVENAFSSGNSANYLGYVYTYDTKDTRGNNATDACDPYARYTTTAIYPNYIYYANRRYRINFDYESRTDFKTGWLTDIMGRAAFEQRRLKEILIEHDTDGNGTFDQVIRKYQFTYYATTDANQIFPGLQWSMGGKTTTLQRFQEFGLNNTALPATTFFYSDQMHLSSVTNGYGASVEFIYDAIPWHANEAGSSSSMKDDFLKKDHGRWGGNILITENPYHEWATVCQGEINDDGDAVCQAPGLAYRNSNMIETEFVKPGQFYRIYGNLSGTGVQVGLRSLLSTGVTWTQLAAFSTNNFFLLPANASSVEQLVSCTNCGFTEFHVEAVLTRYRVMKITLKDAFTKSAILPDNGFIYEYSYESPKANEKSSFNNTCPAIDRNLNDTAAGKDYRVCINEAFTQFMGHSQVIEKSPDGRITLTTFYRDGTSGLLDYALLGKIKTVENRDKNNTLLSKTEYVYSVNQDPPTRSTDSNFFPHHSADQSLRFADLTLFWTRLESETTTTYGTPNLTDPAGKKTQYYYETSYQGNVQYGNWSRKVDSEYKQETSSWKEYRLTVQRVYPTQNTATYLVGLPGAQTVYDCPTGTCGLVVNDIRSSMWYLYDANTQFYTPPTLGILKGQRVLVCYESNGACLPSGTDANYFRYKDTQYGYDTWGNQTTVTTYASYGTQTTIATGNPQRTTTCYGSFSGTTSAPQCADDGYRTYPGWSQNALGQLTRWTYDKTFGVPTQEIDANGNTTTASYDYIGRISKIVAPGDTDASPTLRADYHEDWQPVLFSVWQKVDATHTMGVRKYYDGLGNLIQQQTVDATVNGATKDVVVDYAYTATGQVWKQSVPYEIDPWSTRQINNPLAPNPFYSSQFGASVAATQTIFDEFGRPTKITYPDATEQRMEYLGLQTRTSDRAATANFSANWTTTMNDALGRTSWVEPAVSSLKVNFTYDVLDRLIKTTQSSVDLAVLSYDYGGRKIQMQDVDMGTWTYAYNALGSLTRQADAAGRRTCLYYDGLNRLVTKHYRADNNCPSEDGSVATRDVNYGYDGAAVLHYFDGSSLPAGWAADIPANISVSGGQAHIVGAGAWGPGIRQTSSQRYEGKEIQFSFKLSSSAAINTMEIDTGTWNTAGYRRWSIAAIGGTLYLETYEGTSRNLVSLKTTQANVWYDAKLSVAVSGSNRIFKAVIWERGNPAGAVEVQNTYSTWSDLDWTFRVYSHTGTIDLDRYSEALSGAQGYRSLMTDASGSTTWKYDLRGRMNYELKTITGSGSFLTQYSYNPNSSLASMTYPANNAGAAGEVANFSYLTQAALYSVTTSGFTYVQSSQYDAAGRLTNQQFNSTNALYQRYDYYSWRSQDQVEAQGQGGRLQRISAGTSLGSYNRMQLEYTYTPNGNVDLWNNVPAGERLYFTYDSLSRLTNVSGPVTESYAYETTHGRLSSKDGLTLTYGTSRIHAVSNFNGQTYNYNNNGTLTSRGVWGYGYDYEGQMTSVTQSGTQVGAFTYDGDGNRVKGVVIGVTTVYLGNYFEWTGSTSTMKKYYSAGGKLFALRQGTGTGTTGLQWMLSDHLGSTSKMIDAATLAVAGEVRYKPWGETRYNSGTVATSIGYTGQRQESSLGGIMYYGARWYDGYLNRWLQPDSIIPDPHNPLDFDRYSYVRNNPVRYSDPTGHCIWSSGGVCYVDEDNQVHVQNEVALSEIQSAMMSNKQAAVDLSIQYYGIDKGKANINYSFQREFLEACGSANVDACTRNNNGQADIYIGDMTFDSHSPAYLGSTIRHEVVGHAEPIENGTSYYYLDVNDEKYLSAAKVEELNAYNDQVNNFGLFFSGKPDPRWESEKDHLTELRDQYMLAVTDNDRLNYSNWINSR